MTGLKDIVEKMEAAVKAAGFVPSKEPFSFEAVPDSTIDKAFRIESRVEGANGLMFKGREIDEIISVWIAYKAKRDLKTTRNAAMLDRETVEIALVNDLGLAGLDCDPIIDLAGGEMAEYPNAPYFLSRIDFRINFVQSIAG